MPGGGHRCRSSSGKVASFQSFNGDHTFVVFLKRLLLMVLASKCRFLAFILPVAAALGLVQVFVLRFVEISWYAVWQKRTAENAEIGTPLPQPATMTTTENNAELPDHCW